MAKKVHQPIVVAPNVAAAPKTLYVTISTYGQDGKQIGSRVVDMYHYGTRNWLSNHLWWATHNSCAVETVVASDSEVKEYLTAATSALAEKFAKSEPALMLA